MHPLTKWLNMPPTIILEPLVTNFGVHICFNALTPTKTGFCEITGPSPSGRQTLKQLSKHNSAANNSTVKKFYIRILDLNTKKTTFGVFGFKRGKRENCQILKKNLNFRAQSENLILLFGSFIVKVHIVEITLHICK